MKMVKISYDALLPALFAHISQNIDISVLIDFIKVEFGAEHLQYLGDGIFEMDKDTFVAFSSVDGKNVEHLHKDIAGGWKEIKKKSLTAKSKTGGAK